MNLLVTLDSNYVHQLLVMLKSIEVSNPYESLTVYILHTRLTEFDLALIKRSFPRYKFVPIVPDDSLFDGAHFTKRITKETFYRLLLCDYLPDDVDRILYLDPDTVVLKGLSPLYNHDFGKKCFVGAGHTGGVVEWFNKKRLNMSNDSTYINAGVMMINVNNCRKIIRKGDIRRLIDKKGALLFQADQDIFNALYYEYTDYVCADVYNLDEHTYRKHRLNRDYITDNTVIIHYDGKNKPWNEDYNGSMGEYYDYYERLLRYDKGSFSFPVAN